jgi:integrase
MGYIFKKKWTDEKAGREYEGKNWMIKYYRHGKAYIESSKSDKKKVAEMLLGQREGDISQGKVPGVHFDKVLFEDLAKAFILDYQNNKRDTLKKAERSVRYLAQSFDGMRVTNITTDKIQEYINKRIKDGLSNASIIRELAALKKMFHPGKKANKVNEIPYIPMLEEKNVRKGFFEYEEYIALSDALPSYLKPPVTFAYLSGWRVSEIRNLTWNKVDLKEGIITLDPDEPKNEDGRTLYMNEELIELMRKLFSQRRLDCPYVFNRDGQQIKDFRAAWKNACIKAGLFQIVKDKDSNEMKIPTKIFHDLRRTGVRDMVRSGIPERVVMTISGHKTRSVFDHYNILSDKDLKEAAKARQGHLEKQRENFVPLDTERGEIKQFKQADNE